ncbi:hypothetical protein MLGJGCBP_06986 [Rhodococcus sp. T7]|nr:hypothetical protein MLGJGCBP_09617 [Rhodococcus sp. T7]KAF0959951.1 hypothetical protein MLGJGCBP_06986 [Rhodococcus sp. T7]
MNTVRQVQPRWPRTIIEFHCLIGGATQNPIIATMMRSLMDLLTEFTLRFGAEVPIGDALHSLRTLLEHIGHRAPATHTRV